MAEDVVPKLVGRSYAALFKYDCAVVGGGTAGNTRAARLPGFRSSELHHFPHQGTFYEIITNNRTQVPGYNFEGVNPTNVGTMDSLAAIHINTEPIAADDFPSGWHYCFTCILLSPLSPFYGYSGRKIDHVQGVTFGGAWVITSSF
ncbi:uncharacterized protein GLRG_07703 [Colletotrichum graminicola M1.001]|uniref:Glucose-methanol-choline oxidoreductase N-terminal domain-containing protein n=1 Tax=Colletotrichum graminicola (strain M1.001 / M2 / FGSC 10212) TaxID=645133 RepID=E3QNS6_COLGM|nr:uncharacterized protein GLRG_07703 [Colletotrichum graminicola M1.001]EFQ32433.1 hypothetical protein GLRG_07703 [Colletotrichum graminicola M1.001]